MCQTLKFPLAAECSLSFILFRGGGRAALVFSPTTRFTVLKRSPVCVNLCFSRNRPFLLRLKVNTFAVPLGLSSQVQYSTVTLRITDDRLVFDASGVRLAVLTQPSVWLRAARWPLWSQKRFLKDLSVRTERSMQKYDERPRMAKRR